MDGSSMEGELIEVDKMEDGSQTRARGPKAAQRGECRWIEGQVD